MKAKSKMEDILNGKHICHGTLSCPFTPDWLRKCEMEKEQGKKDQEKIDKHELNQYRRILTICYEDD